MRPAETPQWVPLNPDDIQAVRRALPTPVRDALADNPGEIFLAGGAIAAVRAQYAVRDWDLFATYESLARRVAMQIRGRGRAAGMVETPDALSIYTPYSPTTPIQVITKWTFPTPQALLEAFDFTISQAVIWVDAQGNYQGLASPRFYEDLLYRNLAYTGGGSSPGRSLIRAVKRLREGYSISMSDLATLLAAVYLAGNFQPAARESAVAAVTRGVLSQLDTDYPIVSRSSEAHT